MSEKAGKIKVAAASRSTVVEREGAMTPQVRKSRKPSSPHMKAIGASGFESWDLSLFYRTMQTAHAVRQQDETEEEAQVRIVGMAGIGVEAFKPTDPVEAMFASQAVAMHLAAMECFRRAMLSQQTSDVASKLRRDGTNAARGMSDMVDALARYRGKGPQVIRVEKMMVADGGAAVIGSVTSGATLPTSPSAPKAIVQGTASMITPDVPPVVMADIGEGEGT